MKVQAKTTGHLGVSLKMYRTDTIGIIQEDAIRAFIRNLLVREPARMSYRHGDYSISDEEIERAIKRSIVNE
jgi:hypothetical protein